jgi:hypothetical protein
MLAVGFNAVYVVAKSKSDKRHFFLLLNKISSVIKVTNKHIRRSVAKIIGIETRVDYYKKHTPMSEGDKLSKKEKKIISSKNVENKRKKIETIKKRCDKLEHARNINNLSKVALISLFYSACVLISAVYECRHNIALNENLVIPNILITVFALICLLGDWSCIKKYLNIILFAVSVMGVTVVVLGYIPFSIKHNHIYTISVCFIGFIFYFIAAFVGYVGANWYYWRVSVIEKEINEIDEIIKTEKEEDAKVKEEVMDKNIFSIPQGNSENAKITSVVINPSRNYGITSNPK